MVPAAARRDHAGQHGLGDHKHAFDIDRHDAVPFRFGGFQKWQRGKDARVVHQHSDRAECRRDRRDGLCHLPGIGHVCGRKDHVKPCVAQALRHIGPLAGGQVHDADLCTFGGETF